MQRCSRFLATLVFTASFAAAHADHHEHAEHGHDGHAAAHGEHAGPKVSKLWVVEDLPAPESALYDAAGDRIFVSIIDGGPMDKNSTGRIAIVRPDGTLVDAEFATGLHAPKGLALHGDRLYAADIDTLVVIDATSGEIVAQHVAEGAVFLNDTAADADGNVYVTDMLANRIYRLADGELSVWLEGPELDFPNGIFVEGDTLILGTWGNIVDGFSTDRPGQLRVIDIASKEVSPLPGAAPLGNLDGVEARKGGGYVVSDWMIGKVFVVDNMGQATEILDRGQGAADLGLIKEQDIILLPHMKENLLEAWQIQ